MEQRYQAVSAVIHYGLSVIEVASRFGVSRQMIHIYYKEELLKTALRSNSKEVRKKRASVLKKTS